MIAPKYAQLILNAIFHTGGHVGVSPSEERESLIANGVPGAGITAEQYFKAFEANGYKVGSETAKQYDELKALVNASGWFYTQDTTEEEFQYRNPTSGQTTLTKRFSGWEIKQRSEQLANYPKTAFLALFTKMPDENGEGYKEPNKADNGETTTYMRVDLHNGIVTGNCSLNTAIKDSDSGMSVLDNSEQIVYPEVYGFDWGPIIGFGVFEEEEIDAGIPVLWGRLNNQITATVNRVPLFRTGDFKVTLQ